jgi:hypothetical protein
MAEESSFTRQFANQMVQLDPKHTIIGSSHSFNTFSKKEICITSCLLANPSNPSQGMMYPMALKTTKTADEIMGPEMLKRYSSIFVCGEQDPYEISYFCGGTSIEWDAASQSLGGSEQAVVNLATEWVKMGKRVAVYGKLKNEVKLAGVDYFDWKKFPFNETHDIVVLWRTYGMVTGLPFPLKAKHIWLDLHDGNFPKELMEMWFRYNQKITKVFFKSNFHRELFEKYFRFKLDPKRYTVIPNGVRIETFEQNKDLVKRNPYRFCYCSCYTRGLLEILQHMWPIIKQIEPRAELHVYYGMDSVQNIEFKKVMSQLLASKGVMDHGRQPVDVIVREKYMSSFHLYLSNVEAEIDCITVKESLVTGAIPILSTAGVFREREGIKFDLGDSSPTVYMNIALKIIELMKGQGQSPLQSLDVFRDTLKKSNTIISWIDISAKWIQESF